MKYSVKSRRHLNEEIEAISRGVFGRSGFCKDQGLCGQCPWGMFGHCGKVVDHLSEDERIIACGFMMAIAELGTDY